MLHLQQHPYRLTTHTCIHYYLCGRIIADSISSYSAPSRRSMNTMSSSASSSSPRKRKHALIATKGSNSKQTSNQHNQHSQHKQKSILQYWRPKDNNATNQSTHQHTSTSTHTEANNNIPVPAHQHIHHHEQRELFHAPSHIHDELLSNDIVMRSSSDSSMRENDDHSMRDSEDTNIASTSSSSTQHISTFVSARQLMEQSRQQHGMQSTSSAVDITNHVDNGTIATSSQTVSLTPPQMNGFNATAVSNEIGINEPKQLIDRQTKLIPDVPPFDLKWYEHDSTLLYCTSHHILPSRKIACFDMDHTLIQPKSGRRHPIDRYDWVFTFQNITSTIKNLYSQGYKIVMFSNQKGITTGIADKFHITGKVLDVIKRINVPIQAFIATADDHYRKPFTAMYNYMLSVHNGGIEIDLSQSFYVGDAAGRLRGWNHSDKTLYDRHVTDRRFAYNCKLRFYTPEEYFLKWKPTHRWDWKEHIPFEFLPAHPPIDGATLRSDKQELVILIGIQGSGKTTFAYTHFVPYNYIHCNQDVLGDRKKVLKLVRKSLEAGHSVVVDRTNPSVESRKEFIELAKDMNVPVKSIEIRTEIGIAKRLNAMREVLGSEYQEEKPSVPVLAFHSYVQQYQAPTPEEGISTILTVPFTPIFPSDDLKELFDKVKV